MYKDLCQEFCTEACKKDKPQQKKENDYELDNYLYEDTIPPRQDVKCVTRERKEKTGLDNIDSSRTDG